MLAVLFLGFQFPRPCWVSWDCDSMGGRTMSAAEGVSLSWPTGHTTPSHHTDPRWRGADPGHGTCWHPGCAKTRRGKETRMSPRLVRLSALMAMPFSGCRWRGLGGPTPGCDSGGFAVLQTVDLESPREKREEDWLDWAETKLQVEDQTGQPAICHLRPRHDQQADSLTIPECPGRQTSSTATARRVGWLARDDQRRARRANRLRRRIEGSGGASPATGAGTPGAGRTDSLSAEAEPETRLDRKKTAPPCRHAAAQKAALGDADANAL